MQPAKDDNPESPAPPNPFDSDNSDLSPPSSEPSDCNESDFLDDSMAFGEKLHDT